MELKDLVNVGITLMEKTLKETKEKVKPYIPLIGEIYNNLVDKIPFVKLPKVDIEAILRDLNFFTESGDLSGKDVIPEKRDTSECSGGGKVMEEEREEWDGSKEPVPEMVEPEAGTEEFGIEVSDEQESEEEGEPENVTSGIEEKEEVEVTQPETASGVVEEQSAPVVSSEQQVEEIIIPVMSDDTTPVSEQKMTEGYEKESETLSREELMERRRKELLGEYKIPDLKSLANSKGINLKGLKTKNEIVELILEYEFSQKS